MVCFFMPGPKISLVKEGMGLVDTHVSQDFHGEHAEFYSVPCLGPQLYQTIDS